MGRVTHALLVKAAWIFLGLVASLTGQQTCQIDPVALLSADAQRRAEWASQLLSSDEPLRVAWGAWLARQDHNISLIPLLIEQVGKYQPAVGTSLELIERDRHDAMLVLLDALIGLRATIPVEQARNLYPEFIAQSVILLVRSREDSQAALLDIFQNAKANWTWLAAANVLVKNRTPGFAPLLLGSFTQHIQVSVVDRGVGGGFGGGSSECGFSLRAAKQGWPSVGLYQLTQFPERMPKLDATLLVGGDTTVYFWRFESGNYDDPPEGPGFCDDGNRDQYRAQYLTKLTGISCPSIGLDPYPQIAIVWGGPIRYKEQLTAVVKERLVHFRRVLACLESGQVITSAERKALKPRLEIVIRDERADRSVPLLVVLENDGTTAVQRAFSAPLY